MLAFGFAGFFDESVAVAVFLGVKDRLDLAVATIVTINSSVRSTGCRALYAVGVIHQYFRGCLQEILD